MQISLFLTEWSSVLLGLAIMVCFGTTWFLMSKTSKLIKPWQSQFLFQLIGIPLLIIMSLWLPLPTISTSQIAAIIGLGVLTTVSLVLFLRALEIGEASIVTPITDSSVLITIGLSVWLLHEPLSVHKILGVLLVFGGVVLLGSEFGKKRLATKVNLAAGVTPALLSALIWGVAAVGVAAAARSSHWFFPTFGMRITITLISLVVLFWQRQKFKDIFANVPWKFLVPAAFLDVIAFSLYNFGLQGHAVAYILVFSSAQALVTVLLSWKFSHEKLSWWQIIGLFAIVGGLIAINVLS